LHAPKVKRVAPSTSPEDFVGTEAAAGTGNDDVVGCSMQRPAGWRDNIIDSFQYDPPTYLHIHVVVLSLPVPVPVPD